jgi:hypothetical protein
MDERIESIVKNGTDFAAEYLGKVIAASANLVANVVENAEKLTRAAIEDSAKLAAVARDSFLPKA